MFVNSVRDGMNLVVLEGLVLSERTPAVVLSRETGAAEVLGDDAFVVNPFDVSATAAGAARGADHARRASAGARPSGCARRRCGCRRRSGSRPSSTPWRSCPASRDLRKSLDEQLAGFVRACDNERMDEAPAATTETVRALMLALRIPRPGARRRRPDRAHRTLRGAQVRGRRGAGGRDAGLRPVTARTPGRRGVPTAQQGRGVAGQVGLARRISPWSAQRYLGWARILPDELPETFALLQSGRITEWRATLVARETVFLSREDRAQADAELAPRLESWGDRQVEAEARRAAYRLDPPGFLARIRGAEKDRRVTLRPAPEAMTRLTALLPVAQGVAAYAALCRTADSTTAGGDERGRGQIMADTLVERVTGQASADAVPVEVELVLTDHTLLGTDDPRADEPGQLIGGGPVPAGLARELALEGARSLRRLFTSPVTGQLVAMESKARAFTAGQRRFIRYRDQGRCRTPWCDATIRHTDHITPHGRGGPTRVANGQGYCEACNHAKQAPGWQGYAWAGESVVITPTGHRYGSRAPDAPGASGPESPIERRLRSLLDVA